MQAYMDGDVGDDQMAMLMMLIRVRDETPEEIAGFVEALTPKNDGFADLDWPLYAGKRVGQSSGLPWHLLSANILAQNGLKILLHGDLDKTSNRLHARDYLQHLHIPVARDIEHASELVSENNIAYLPLDNFLPQAKRMLDWKLRYGLRTPINTVVRALNPSHAPYALRGSFHPGFQELHAVVESLISRHDKGNRRTVSFKGQSGETEFNPKVSQTIWWAESDKVHSSYIEEAMQAIELPLCPLGTPQEERELMANTVLSTLTVALFAVTGDWSQASAKAKQYWNGYRQSLTDNGMLC
jgi:anthranilate phosphoribosyltransferase